MAHDYRYFPDPDLMPVKVDEAWKSRIRAECPELPFDKQRRFFAQYQVPYTITSVLVPDRELSDYFEEAAKLAPGKAQAVGNWIANDLLRELGNAKRSLADSKVRPSPIAALVQLIDAGIITNQAAKEVFVDMFQSGEMPDAIVARKGLKAETNSGELEQWCRDAITANAKALAEFKAGKDSAINAFKGPVMKAAKGKANPKLVDETLRRLMAAM
jgi:aspartyl-tRNA(Asn)/glutamyl-tRNA(Gln) amidotransferase subunit B